MDKNEKNTKPSDDERRTLMENLDKLKEALGSKPEKMDGAIVWFPDLSRPAKPEKNEEQEAGE